LHFGEAADVELAQMTVLDQKPLSVGNHGTVAWRVAARK
jgi:hypothetical protein